MIVSFESVLHGNLFVVCWGLESRRAAHRREINHH